MSSVNNTPQIDLNQAYAELNLKAKKGVFENKLNEIKTSQSKLTGENQSPKRSITRGVKPFFNLYSKPKIFYKDAADSLLFNPNSTLEERKFAISEKYSNVTLDDKTIDVLLKKAPNEEVKKDVIVALVSTEYMTEEKRKELYVALL